MGKKVREYKSGDFIFAKVKGYPAWPARVQRLNGKKYFVYFYGTGETANLPPNMIFDYAENKDKFLTKTQKRRDFNDGVKQIEHDFANNVPLEEVIGVPTEGADTPADDTVDDSVNDTMDETADTTTANDTADDDTITNTTQNEAPVEDSDENGALVIDEGKSAKKKLKPDPKTPAKDTKAKEPKTPRGKAKKEEEKPEPEDEKKEEEIVSRSGRKIRPKRFVDEQTEENSTLPSPAPKKKRAASPQNEKDKPEPKDKNIKSFNAVTQSELEELKQPFKPEDAEKENILIAYLPTGKYVGIKLFQSRPIRFKNEASRLQWDKLAASNAITLRMQLETGQISAMSVQGQLVMDLNLTDEEKSTLDRERETEEKKSRVQFLKTEMKLIELDAKIKTCLSLEKADAELCLQMLDELNSLDVKALMLLKHPTCVETVKRLRAYVGNTPSWDLTERAAVTFNKHAHRIRKQADTLYKHLKSLFTTPDGLSFWEYFSERVLQFKKVAAKLGASELLEMVHEPIEMSQPTSHTMNAAIDAANEEANEDEPPKKKTNAKGKKAINNNTPAPKSKRQSRKQADDEEKDDEKDAEETAEEGGKGDGKSDLSESTEDVEMSEAPPKDVVEPNAEKDSEVTQEVVKNDKSKDLKKGKAKEGKKSPRNAVKNAKEAEKNSKEVEKSTKEAEKSAKVAEKSAKEAEKVAKEAEKPANEAVKEAEPVDKEAEKDDKEAEKSSNTTENTAKDSDEVGKEVEKDVEPENNSENLENSKDEESSPKNDEPMKDCESTNHDSPKDAEITEAVAKTPEKSPKKNPKDSQKDGKKSELDDKNPETEPPKTPEKDKDEPKEKTKKKGDKKDVKEDKKETEKRKDDDKAKDENEPRAKRSRETRESKKTDAPPPRSPAKRKTKY